MSIHFLILFFILGLIIGSFLNVVIHRFKTKESVIKKRSYCPHCKKTLKNRDLIPVLSFLLLKGKCRYCKKPIAIQYPLVELVLAFLFLALYLKFGFSFSILYYFVIAIILLIIFFFDLRYYIIPDWLVIPGAIVAFLGGFFVLKLSILNLVFGLLIGGGFFLLLMLFTKGKGMGMGDVKLGGFAGLILGFPQIVLALFFTFVLGGLMASVLLLTGKKKRKDLIPFAPFFVIAILLVIFFGKNILGLLGI